MIYRRRVFSVIATRAVAQCANISAKENKIHDEGKRALSHYQARARARAPERERERGGQKGKVSEAGAGENFPVQNVKYHGRSFDSISE